MLNDEWVISKLYNNFLFFVKVQNKVRKNKDD